MLTFRCSAYCCLLLFMRVKPKLMISQKHRKGKLSASFKQLVPTHWLVFFLVFFMICLSFSSIGQTISFSNGVPTEINVCDNAETFTIEFTNTSGDPLTNISIGVAFPSGILYQVGSITDNSGFNIQETSISNLSNISFSMDDLPGASTVSFSFLAEADFPALAYHQSGELFRNTITVDFTGGSEANVTNAYNLLYPALTITNVTPMLSEVFVGQTFTRTITIVNGGYGKLSSFVVADVHDNNLDLVAVDLGNLNTATNEITFSAADFTGVGDGDGYFEKNESIVFVQTITAEGCSDAQSALTAYWGCNGETDASNTKYPDTEVTLYAPNIAVNASSSFNTCVDGSADVQQLVYTNNGTGPANDVVVEVYNNPSSAYTRIDEGSIQLTQGGSTVTLIPDALQDAEHVCLGSNPKGGFTVTLPPIQPGESVTLNWDSYTCDTEVCAIVNLFGWKYKTDYTDMCFQQTYTKNGTGKAKQYKDFDVFYESPSDLSDGETGTYTFILQKANFRMPAGTAAYFKLEFDVPVGLTWSGNTSDLSFSEGGTSWAAETISFDPATRTLNAWYPLPIPISLLRSEVNLNLTLDCNQSGATSGLATVSMQLLYLMDETCSMPYRLPLTCIENPMTYLHCPSDCDHGLAFESFGFARTSFGSPDNDQDGLADGSGNLDASKIKLNRVMVSDTFQTVMNGTIKTSGTYPSWSYAYASSDIPNGNKIKYIDATVSIFDASANTTLVCSGVSASQNLSSGVRTVSFDFSPATLVASGCSDFVGWVFEDGDEVTLTARYRVSGNIGGSIEQGMITNSFYVSDSPSGSAFQCGDWNGNFTMVGYYFRNRKSEQYNVEDCSVTIAQNFYMSVGNCCTNYAGGDLFPYEYRNWATVEDLRVEIPVGYTYLSSTMEQDRTRYTNSTATESSNITPTSINAQTLLFDLSQYYTTNGGTINPSDDGFNGTIEIELDPACDINPAANLPMAWYFTFMENVVLGGDETSEYSTTSDYLQYKPANLVVTATQEIQEGIYPTVTWNIKVKNPSSTPASNGWLNFYSSNNTIDISSLVATNSSATISPTDGFYQLGSIAAGATQNYVLTASYDDCNNSTLSIRSGYSCDGYPTDLGSFACGYDEFSFFIYPQESELQVRINSVNNSDECGTTVGVEVEILSAKLAAVKDIMLNIEMPPSLSVGIEDGSVQVLYPESGTYQTIGTPTLSGVNYVITGADMDATIGTDGLIGITNVNANLLKLKFNLGLSESFKVGEFVRFSLNSNRACGDALPEIDVAYDPSAVFNRTFNIGLDQNYDTRAVSWGDYDNDGWIDAFVTTYEDSEPNLLYHNDGDGTFSQVTTGDIANAYAPSLGATWGDYDNDGDLDLFVANNIGHHNFLYRNNGNGTFTSLQDDPVINDLGYAHGVNFVDYDNDGFIDLFTAHYFPTSFNKLYHNNGDGTFSAVADGNAVISEASFSVAGAWADYNNDGLPDLFVANTQGENNSLYRNEGNGSFTSITTGAVVTDAGNSVGASWGDYDNDGDLDLFVANAGNQNNFLYRNDGSDNFTRITTGDIVNDGGHSHGSSWVDYDNDGDLDLTVTNNQDQNNFLYSNQGDGTFLKVTNQISQDGGASMGSSWADYDNDGDMDLYVTNHDGGIDFFYGNSRGSCQSHFCISLQGTISNASAIGAKIAVKANIYGNDVWQTREVSSQTGGGLGGQNDMRLIFGLGNATQVDSVIVTWPSGYQQIVTDPSLLNCVEMIEDNGSEVCGYVYNDENRNCIKDNVEEVLANARVLVQPGNRLVLTDENGYYSTILAPGSYNLTHQASDNWERSCAESYAVEVTQMGAQYCGHNFADTATCTLPDLRLELASTTQRVGFENLIAITVSNEGTETATGVELYVDFDANISIEESNIPWTGIQGRIYNWSFASLAIGERKTIYLKETVSINAQVGNGLAISGNITSTEGDCNGADNSLSESLLAEGAVDPNDIAVDPEGFIEAGTELTYKIRFQNVGNSAVSRVMVEDALPEGLDLTTLQMGLVSHPYQFYLKEDGQMVWTFENINLPDSSSNEADSHGYIFFKIKTQDDLSDGTVLENGANIFFDQQAAVATNTVQNIIGVPAGESIKGQLRIQPNPAEYFTSITINKRLTEMVSLSLYDMSGRQIFQVKGLDQREYQLERKQWSAGAYLVKAVSIDGEVYSGKLILR